MTNEDEEIEYKLPEWFLDPVKFKELQQLIENTNAFLSHLENAPILELHFDGRWFLVVRIWR